ncbi:MAG: hypothetical protein DYH20_02425 [Gammaproteobacteria bacterium PRO9]|nr:hypothetical protein [Gammaproteobacteria bacterium PRO9]
MADDALDLELRMDESDLYQEEVFTDRRVGTIQRLTPIDKTGKADAARPVLYVGQTQLMSRMGALPLSFDIPAKSLEEAFGNFAKAANGALQDTMQKLEEMRREQASSLIVPEAGGGFGGGMAGGVPGGGGRIRMP